MKRLAATPMGAMPFRSFSMVSVRQFAAPSPISPPSGRRRFSIDDVLAGKRYALAKAITLVESNRQGDALEIANVLRELRSRREASGLKATELELSSMRIAISGSPGAGKSCFIEALGCLLTGHYKLRVGVIAVDPSSTVSGGSILGDKTRMEKLSTCEAAFVRPSPSRGHLGGVTARCWESMEILEAASFDVVLVETVGVGQSEVAARDMTDLFVLLVPPASGDELQGIKKGIVEVSDMVIVTKNDGSNDKKLLAQQTKAAYTRAVMFQRNYHNFRGAYTDVPAPSASNSGAHRRSSKETTAVMMGEQVLEKLPTQEEAERIEREAREDALGDSLKPVLAVSTEVEAGEAPDAIRSYLKRSDGLDDDLALTNPSIDIAWRRLARMWQRRKASGQLRLLRRTQTLNHFNEYFNEELKLRARILLEGGTVFHEGGMAALAATAADPNVRRILEAGARCESTSQSTSAAADSRHHFAGLLTALEDAVVRKTMAPREAGDVALAVVLGNTK